MFKALLRRLKPKTVVRASSKEQRQSDRKLYTTTANLAKECGKYDEFMSRVGYWPEVK